MTMRLLKELLALQVGETITVGNAEIRKLTDADYWFGKGTQWAPITGPGFHITMNGTDEDENSGDVILQDGELWRKPGGVWMNLEG